MSKEIQPTAQEVVEEAKPPKASQEVTSPKGKEVAKATKEPTAPKETQKPERATNGNAKQGKPYCVYLGPTVKGINHGAVLLGSRDQVLEGLQDIIQQYPQIAGLIVPSERVATDRIKVKTPGNLLYEAFRQMLQGK